MSYQEAAQLLGNVGEFVGAIGVVATLAYLAVQIRQSTRSTRALTYSDVTGGWQGYLQNQSVEDLELLLRLNVDHRELSDAQFLRAYFLTRVMFRRMEHDYYQYRGDTFERGTWQAYVRAFVRDTFTTPANRAMWRLQEGFFDPDFTRFMDGVIADLDDGEPHLRSDFARLYEAEHQRVAGTPQSA